MPRLEFLDENSLEQLGFAFDARFRIFGDDSGVVSAFFAAFHLHFCGGRHNASDVRFAFTFLVARGCNAGQQ